MTLLNKIIIQLILFSFICIGHGGVVESEPETSDGNLKRKPKRIEFKCPTPNGLFPHPEQCDRFFECKDGHLQRRLCGDGLVFHGQKSESEDPCDHVQNTEHKCRGRPRLQKAKPGDANCPRQNGVYKSPDPSQCGQFFSCLNGVGSSHQCAEGLHFSPDIGTCVWPRESGRKHCSSSSSSSKKSSQRSQGQRNQDKYANVNKNAYKPQNNNNYPQNERSGAGGFQCPGGRLGIHSTFPHPTSCKLYYVCLNGEIPKEASCGPGLVFNKATSKCDRAQNVDGCDNTLSSSKFPSSKSIHRHTSSTKSKNLEKAEYISSNHEDLDTDSIDVRQLAKFIDILTNPAIKKIIKPDVVESIEAFTNANKGGNEKRERGNDDGSRNDRNNGEVLRRKKRPRKINNLTSSRNSNDLPAPHGNNKKMKRPFRNYPSRRNKFAVSPRRRSEYTSKFIPKIKTNRHEVIRGVDLSKSSTIAVTPTEPTTTTVINSLATSKIEVKEDNKKSIEALKISKKTKPKVNFENFLKSEFTQSVSSNEFQEFEKEFITFLDEFKRKRKQEIDVKKEGRVEHVRSTTAAPVETTTTRTTTLQLKPTSHMQQIESTTSSIQEGRHEFFNNANPLINEISTQKPFVQTTYSVTPFKVTSPNSAFGFSRFTSTPAVPTTPRHPLPEVRRKPHFEINDSNVKVFKLPRNDEIQTTTNAIPSLLQLSKVHNEQPQIDESLAVEVSSKRPKTIPPRVVSPTPTSRFAATKNDSDPDKFQYIYYYDYIYTNDEDSTESDVEFRNPETSPFTMTTTTPRPSPTTQSLSTTQFLHSQFARTEQKEDETVKATTPRPTRPPVLPYVITLARRRPTSVPSPQGKQSSDSPVDNRQRSEVEHEKPVEKTLGVKKPHSFAREQSTQPPLKLRNQSNQVKSRTINRQDVHSPQHVVSNSNLRVNTERTRTSSRNTDGETTHPGHQSSFQHQSQKKEPFTAFQNFPSFPRRDIYDSEDFSGEEFQFSTSTTTASPLLENDTSQQDTSHVRNNEQQHAFRQQTDQNQHINKEFNHQIEEGRGTYPPLHSDNSFPPNFPHKSTTIRGPHPAVNSGGGRTLSDALRIDEQSIHLSPTSQQNTDHVGRFLTTRPSPSNHNSHPPSQFSSLSSAKHQQSLPLTFQPLNSPQTFFSSPFNPNLAPPHPQFADHNVYPIIPVPHPSRSPSNIHRQPFKRAINNETSPHGLYENQINNNNNKQSDFEGGKGNEKQLKQSEFHNHHSVSNSTHSHDRIDIGGDYEDGRRVKYHTDDYYMYSDGAEDGRLLTDFDEELDEYFMKDPEAFDYYYDFLDNTSYDMNEKGAKKVKPATSKSEHREQDIILPVRTIEYRTVPVQPVFVQQKQHPEEKVDDKIKEESQSFSHQSEEDENTWYVHPHRTPFYELDRHSETKKKSKTTMNSNRHDGVIGPKVAKRHQAHSLQPVRRSYQFFGLGDSKLPLVQTTNEFPLNRNDKHHTYSTRRNGLSKSESLQYYILPTPNIPTVQPRFNRSFAYKKKTRRKDTNDRIKFLNIGKINAYAAALTH